MLVAITGKAGSGKDTAAGYLIKQLGFIQLAFADALKDSVMFKFGLSHDDVYTHEGKKRFVEHWGLTVGEILQREGTEGTKPYWGEDFWIQRWLMDYDAHVQDGFDDIVVTDCRFDNEAEQIKKLGGKIIMIDRPGLVVEGRDPNHPSERGINSDFIDLVICNKGSKAKLGHEILNAVEAWKA